MDVVFLIGRILFALILIGSAVGHLTDASSAEYAKAKGVPNAELLVRLSGITMLASGLGIILGIWIDLALLGMAAQVAIFAVVMHQFWSADPESKQTEMAMFMKNISMAGGALALFALVQPLDDVPLTLVGNLF